MITSSSGRTDTPPTYAVAEATPPSYFESALASDPDLRERWDSICREKDRLLEERAQVLVGIEDLQEQRVQARRELNEIQTRRLVDGDENRPLDRHENIFKEILSAMFLSTESVALSALAIRSMKLEAEGAFKVHAMVPAVMLIGLLFLAHKSDFFNRSISDRGLLIGALVPIITTALTAANVEETLINGGLFTGGLIAVLGGFQQGYVACASTVATIATSYFYR